METGRSSAVQAAKAGVPVVSLLLVAIVVLSAAGLAVFIGGLGFPFVLICGTLAMLATGVIPEYLTAFLFFTLAMLGRVGAPELVFSGFASSAFWLVLSGLILGLAVSKTGLGERMASAVSKAFPATYGWSLLGVGLFGTLLAFFMPSAMGRLLLYLPIVRSLALGLGYEDGSQEMKSLMLCGILCSFLAGMTILPANVANLVFSGTVESAGLPVPTYLRYLLLHFPVLGGLKMLMICGVLYRLYPGRPVRSAFSCESRSWTAAERRLVPVLVLCLLFWSTDSLHGISPAWIGMLGAIACLMPGSGILDSRCIKQLNIAPLFYVAAIISLGVVVHESGIGNRAATLLMDVLPLSGNSFADFGVLSALACLMGPLTTQPGIPAVMTPLAPQLSAAAGLSLGTVLMTQVVGFSTVLLPFQTAPIMVGIRTVGISVAEGSRAVAILAALTVLLLWPLDYLWWSLLGVV